MPQNMLACNIYDLLLSCDGHVSIGYGFLFYNYLASIVLPFNFYSNLNTIIFYMFILSEPFLIKYY